MGPAADNSKSPLMIWFLRLFSAFRDMEALLEMQAQTAEDMEADLKACHSSLEDVGIEKLQLQDRLESALSDKEHLWAAMNEALGNERDALRMQVNHAVQKSGGGIPYPDSHSLPPSAARPLQAPGPVGRSGRRLPSEMGQDQTNKFIAEFAKVKR